jgi:hypothetical protein
VRVRLKRLRPTQLSVGYGEVAQKAAQWSRLGKKRLAMELEHHVFPGVLGPGREYFIIDHHHLGIALIEKGIDEVLLAVLDDLSWLTPAVFWRTMEFRTWSHPYDHRGQRQAYSDMPRRLTDLQDDPYRTLAGLVRAAGGFAKDQAPFCEFLWADFFRPRISIRLIKKEPRKAVRIAVRMSRSNEARYLPGWSGLIST